LVHELAGMATERAPNPQRSLAGERVADLAARSGREESSQ
jgi:hypothetical protein